MGTEQPRARPWSALRVASGVRLTGALSALSVGVLSGMSGLLWLLAGGTMAAVTGRSAQLSAAMNELSQRADRQLVAERAAQREAQSPPPPASAAPRACPEDMVLIEGSFCPQLPYTCVAYVDDAEYRCAQYARGQRCQLPADERRYCIDRHEWPNRVGEQPTVFVNWNEAKASCAGVGKRLCRRSEWVLACEGPKRLPYPWGYRRRPSPCNIDRASVPFDIDALVKPDKREAELDRLWQADRIGSHPDCVSAFGVYDMTGNVDEWTDNELDDPLTKRPSTLNGGYWGPVRDTCRLTTKKHTPKFRFYQVGFRCCRDPLSGPFPKPKVWSEGKDRYKGYEDD